MSISKHTSCQLEKSISLLANVKIQYHFFPMSKFPPVRLNKLSVTSRVFNVAKLVRIPKV